MQEKLLQINDDGSINATYNKIVNCEIIKPTFNKDGFASTNLMLDKRKGLLNYINKPGVSMFNELDIEGVTHYYGINKSINKGYVYNSIGTQIYEVDTDADSPNKMIKGSGAGGRIILNATATTNNLSPLSSVRNASPYRAAGAYLPGDSVTSASVTYICLQANTGEPVTAVKYWRVATPTPTSDLLVPYYNDSNGGGLIALNVPGNNWTSLTQSYITFTTGILKGNTNKILYAVGDIIYILGTDVYGSLPANNDKYYIFSDSREVLLIGAVDGLHVISITDQDTAIANKYQIILSQDTYNHWTFKVDGVSVVINGTVLADQKTLLESFLSASYIVTINDNFLFLNKVDGSVITFSDLTQAVLLDADLLAGDYIEGFWTGVNFTLDGNSLSIPLHGNGMTYTGIQEYGPPYLYSSTGTYNKTVFYNYIISQLPVGYTGVIKTLSGLPSITNVRDLGLTPGRSIFNANQRLLITKDNNTELAFTMSNYNYYLITFTNTDADPWTCSISVNGTVIYNVSSIWYSSYVEGPVIRAALITAGYTCTAFGTRYLMDGTAQPGTYRLLVRGNVGQELTISVTQSVSRVSVYHDSNNMSAGAYIKPQTSLTAINSSSNFININETSGYGYKVIDGVPIKDLVEYNGAIFAMTKTSIFYSRIKFDGNTGFYILDFIPYKGGTKLVPFGRSLLCFGFTNKIISETQDKVTSYAMVDLEYNGDLFSKYSYIYDEGNLFILQKDKVVIQATIIQSDKNTYAIQTQELNTGLRWLFENAEGECYISRHNGSYNFLVINGEETTNYKFHISFKTWILNKYNRQIFNIGDHVLSKSDILLEGGFNDLGVEYAQEIFMSIGTLIKFTKINIMRTIFGLNNEFELNLDLNVEYEMGNGNIIYQSKKLNGFQFDTDRTLTLDEGDLIEDLTDNYSGSIASIQETLASSGKYIRIKYSSLNRFIIGDTYFLTEDSKAIVNNISNSN